MKLSTKHHRLKKLENGANSTKDNSATIVCEAGPVAQQVVIASSALEKAFWCPLCGAMVQVNFHEHYEE